MRKIFSTYIFADTTIIDTQHTYSNADWFIYNKLIAAVDKLNKCILKAFSDVANNTGISPEREFIFIPQQETAQLSQKTFHQWILI